MNSQIFLSLGLPEYSEIDCTTIPLLPSVTFVLDNTPYVLTAEEYVIRFDDHKAQTNECFVGIVPENSGKIDVI